MKYYWGLLEENNNTMSQCLAFSPLCLFQLHEKELWKSWESELESCFLSVSIEVWHRTFIQVGPFQVDKESWSCDTTRRKCVTHSDVHNVWRGFWHCLFIFRCFFSFFQFWEFQPVPASSSPQLTTKSQISHGEREYHMGTVKKAKSCTAFSQEQQQILHQLLQSQKYLSPHQIQELAAAQGLTYQQMNIGLRYICHIVAE